MTTGPTRTDATKSVVDPVVDDDACPSDALQVARDNYLASTVMTGEITMITGLLFHPSDFLARWTLNGKLTSMERCDDGDNMDGMITFRMRARTVST